MEEEVHQFWGEINLGKINFGMFASILYVYVQDAENRGQEIGEDPKAISVGGYY